MSLKRYLGSDDEEYCRSVEDKARVIGYMRLLRRSIRRPEEKNAQANIAYYKSKLVELVDKIDSLTF